MSVRLLQGGIVIVIYLVSYSRRQSVITPLIFLALSFDKLDLIDHTKAEGRC